MIDVHALSRTYDVGTEHAVAALRGVTFGIGGGELVAIMGASGSGKSTLLHLLGCLDRPTAGRYLLDGQDVTVLDADGRATVRGGKIGFVFQGFHLLPRTTARENVELPLVYSGVSPAEHRSRAEAALSAVGLAGAGARLPTQLSGGQQQRVAIARALVARPRLLLADEPTGNLDSQTSDQILDLLRALNRSDGLTTVLVTHDTRIARTTDRVLLLRDGSLVADGPPDAMLRASGVGDLP